MLGKTRFLVLGVIAAGAAGVAGGIVALRRRADKAEMAPRAYLAGTFRHLVAHRLDPIVTRLGLGGDRVSGWAVLEHVNRATGVTHRMPVFPRLSGTTAYIPVPYSEDAQWVQDVMAAGHCRVQLHERVYELDEPRIVGGDDVEAVWPLGRRFARRIGAKYLALHRLSDVVGTFAPLGDAAGTPEEDWLIAPLEPAPEVPAPAPAGTAR